MFVEFGTSVSRAPGQVPNAHRSAGTVAFGPRTLSRTVSVEWAVFVLAVSYDVKLALPSRVSVNVPDRGIVRSEYSRCTGATIDVPSSRIAIGNEGIKRWLPGATSPCQPASTIVYPSRIKNPSPASSDVNGSFVSRAKLNRPIEMALPRLLIVYSTL